MFSAVLGETSAAMKLALSTHQAKLEVREVGRLIHIEKGIARITGLPGVKSMELVRFYGDVMGLAFNLDLREVGVVLLGDYSTLKAGTEVQRTHRVIDVPVGDGLLGRVVNGLGEPLDEQDAISATEQWPIEREAPPILKRTAVDTPLETGIKVIDALIPIGRGQRQLILGDRQTGKTAIAVDTILNQKGRDVICLYCAIAQRRSAVARVIAALRTQDAMKYCALVVAAADDPPGLQYITPYSATTMAEYFMQQGRDVLLIYDDLTHHAHAYRELSLLLRRPPGREAYPGDIFYIHSRLLERATHLRQEEGGGSLTVLPVIETQAQNISAYIPTNLISITDGQVYLSPELFQKGNLPAVDVGKSVSRVGGKAQLPAFRSLTSEVRLAYTQFEELESFARFGTRLDDASKAAIDRGNRIREILKQEEAQPLTPCQQITVLLALNSGLFDQLPLGQVKHAENRLCQVVNQKLPLLCARIQKGELLVEEDIETALALAKEVLEDMGS